MKWFNKWKAHKNYKCCKLISAFFIYLFFFYIYIFLSALSGSVSSSAFNSLVSVPVGIVSSTAGWKICAICAN